MEVSKVSNYESYNFNGLVFSHLGSKSKVLMGKFIAIEKKKSKFQLKVIWFSNSHVNGWESLWEYDS